MLQAVLVHFFRTPHVPPLGRLSFGDITMRAIRFGAVALVAVTLLSASPGSAQVSNVDFTVGNGGYVAQNLGTGTNPWFWTSGTGWAVNSSNTVSLERLLSPVLTATGSAWGLNFTHQYNFENTFDGGQVWMSVNGGAFSLLGTSGAPYTGTLSTAFSSPRGGQAAFTGLNSGNISTTFSGATTAGTTFQFAFDGAWDNSVSSTNPNWLLTAIEYRDFSTPNNVVPEPATMSLLATGLVGMIGAGMRRRKKA